VLNPSSRASTFAIPSGRVPNVASLCRPFTTSLTVLLPPGGDDEPVSGHGGELRCMVRALGLPLKPEDAYFKNPNCGTLRLRLEAAHSAV